MKGDGDSCIYFADVLNDCIKKLNYTTRVVSLIARTAAAGYFDITGNETQFNAPVNL